MCAAGVNVVVLCVLGARDKAKGVELGLRLGARDKARG